MVLLVTANHRLAPAHYGWSIAFFCIYDYSLNIKVSVTGYLRGGVIGFAVYLGIYLLASLAYKVLGFGDMLSMGSAGFFHGKKIGKTHEIDETYEIVRRNLRKLIPPCKITAVPTIEEILYCVLKNVFNLGFKIS